MSDKKDRNIVDSRGGILNDFTIRIKLIMRLMMDPRVNPFIKLLPIGSLVYLLFPDIVPGPLDDVAIIWLGSYLFVELCPPEVVKEHMDALTQVVPGEWSDPPGNPNNEVDQDIVDAEYWEADE